MFPLCDVRGVHATPVGEERMVPPAPTVTFCVVLPATPYRSFAVPDVRAVQAAPSAEVRIVPASPTLMNCDSVQATPRRRLAVPEVRGVQVIRSGEVTIVPESPTATYCVPDVATPLRWKLTPDGVLVQEMPSEDLRMVPSAPTATAAEADEVTPNKVLVVPDLAEFRTRRCSHPPGTDYSMTWSAVWSRKDPRRCCTRPSHRRVSRQSADPVRRCRMSSGNQCRTSCSGNKRRHSRNFHQHRRLSRQPLPWPPPG